MRFRSWLALAAGAALGATATYLSDPERGRQRRVEARKAASAKAAEYELDQKARYYLNQLRGTIIEAIQSVRPEGGQVDDATLRAKVESEVLGPADVSSGQVNVDVADGVVTLRGQIGNDRVIEDLVRTTRGVRGVREVNNLLHLKNDGVMSSDSRS